MVRSRFMAQMEQLNTELIVMGTLCENALEKVANALDNPTDEVSRDIQKDRGKRKGTGEYLH